MVYVTYIIYHVLVYMCVCVKKEKPYSYFSTYISITEIETMGDVMGDRYGRWGS